MAKCKVGCTCKLHNGAGSRKCELNCLCGRHNSEVHAHAARIRWQDLTYKKTQRAAIKRAAARPEFRQRMSVLGKILGQDPKLRQQRSDALKARWQDPVYREAQVVRALLGNRSKPNQLELDFIALAEGWQYVGDGQLIIGGKCPDFWDGNDRLIELYGDYWHRGQDPQDRIDHFAQYGYWCRVIWESEFRADPEAAVRRAA